MNCVNGALEVCDSGLSGCSSGLVQHLRKMQNIFRNPFSVLDYWRISMDFNHHLCRTSTCCDMLCHSVMCSFLQLFVVARFGTLVFFIIEQGPAQVLGHVFPLGTFHVLQHGMDWDFSDRDGLTRCNTFSFRSKTKIWVLYWAHIYMYIYTYISHRIHVFNIW